MKLLFPDSLYNIENISCANFLYFKKENVALPLQPSISMPIGGCNPYEFLLYVQARHPKWQNTYFTIYNEWVKTTKRFGQTLKCLEPLREIGVMKSILMSYSRTEKTLCDTIAFIKSTKISYKDLISMIDLDQAFQELMAHLCFEIFLELYGPRENVLDQNLRNIDFQALYQYCDIFFKKYSLEEALVNCYFFRFYNVKNTDGILLSNTRIIPILDAARKIHQKKIQDESNRYNDLTDVVA